MFVLRGFAITRLIAVIFSFLFNFSPYFTRRGRKGLQNIPQLTGRKKQAYLFALLIFTRALAKYYTKNTFAMRNANNPLDKITWKFTHFHSLIFIYTQNYKCS